MKFPRSRGAEPTTLEAEALQPGQLMESMQAGLRRIHNLQGTFAELRAVQAKAVEQTSDLDEVLAMVKEVQVAPAQVNYVLEHRSRAHTYSASEMRHAGYAALVLGSEKALLKRERDKWTTEPDVAQWVGKTVAAVVPSEGEYSKDIWGNHSAHYKLFQGPGYCTGSMSYFGTPAFVGQLKAVSLEGEGEILIVSPSNDRRGVHVTEAFSIPHTVEKSAELILPRLAVLEVPEDGSLDLPHGTTYL